MYISVFSHRIKIKSKSTKTRIYYILFVLYTLHNSQRKLKSFQALY